MGKKGAGMAEGFLVKAGKIELRVKLSGGNSG
jgi:hypothetical protein